MMNLTGMDPAGVLVIDRARKILFTNTRARELLGGDAGLDERHNTLRGASAALERRLFAALDPAAIVGSKVVPQAFMYLPRPRRMPLLAAVTALPEEAAEGLGALVLVWDPAVMPALPAHVLMHLFRLTHAEALTALALYDGQSPSQIAQQRQRSVHTVRSLLARVFMKCGVKRQAELVRLLAGVLHAASLAEGVKIGMGVQRAMDAHPHDPQAFARIQYFSPGQATSVHRHTHGHEVICVLRGTVTTQFEDGAAATTRAGEALYIGSERVHCGSNRSQADSQVLAINVAERGRPFRVDLPQQGALAD